MIKLKDLKPDKRNANKGTAKGQKMIVRSIQEDGFGRSGLLDKNGQIIAGNKTTEAATEVFGVDAEPIIVETDGKRPVYVKRTDLDLETDEAARRLAYRDNLASHFSFELDPAQVMADIESGFDFEKIDLSLMDLGELLGGAAGELLGTDEKNSKIGRGGRLYNAGDGHQIEPFKLAYRIESAWKMNGNLAIDLFSGEGQLASWYRRRFKTVITNDKNYPVGDVDYSLSAIEFINTKLADFIDFDFIDFDDEGTPAREIATLFAVIAGKKLTPFVMALTDGNGINLKFRGQFDFGLYDGVSGKRKATRDDYINFEEMVSSFVRRVATEANFAPTCLSSYRGREGNVVFQTWLIEPNCVAQPGAGCDSHPVNTAEGLS